ncbi:MAG: alpha/beta hydrolase [Dysgonomonas sp.]|nr:alpha/beta hydrolase [Dysgonomonas sp.]
MRSIFLMFVFLFIIVGFTYSQNVIIDGISRDTSFTLHSAYVKEKKYRPYIEKVLPQLPEGVRVFENITYSQPYEGRELLLNLYRANDNKKYPALIMVFGGGWSSGSLQMQVPMAQQIAKQGYVTIPVEYRLSPEAQYPAAVYDLKTAVRWARANADKYGIDTTKIAISGCSAGGQLAALIGITNGQPQYEDKKEYPEYSSTVQAVINIDGVTNFFGAELDSNKEALAKGKKSPAAIRWLGNFDEKEENWKAASSVYHITEHSAPVCFINSSIPRFHDGRDDAIEKLNSYGIYSEVHEIPDTPHPFWLFKPWFDTNVGYMVNFLNKMFK